MVKHYGNGRRANCGKRPHQLHGLDIALPGEQATCKRCLVKAEKRRQQVVDLAEAVARVRALVGMVSQ